MHGGNQQNKPATHLITHGQRSEYVKLDAIPAIIASAEKLRTADGKLDLLSTNAATIQHRVQSIPDEPQFLPTLIQAHHSMRSDVMALADVEKAKLEAAESPPVAFVLNNWDPEKQAPFVARGIDGPITVRYIDGVPYQEFDEGDSWRRVVEQTDEESQARYFVREEK